MSYETPNIDTIHRTNQFYAQRVHAHAREDL